MTQEKKNRLTCQRELITPSPPNSKPHLIYTLTQRTLPQPATHQQTHRNPASPNPDRRQNKGERKPPKTKPMTQTALFGGALRAVLPAGLEDAAQYRPVPDTQEVFVSRSYDSDLSVIFDILQRVPGTDEQAVAVHWDDITPSPPTHLPGGNSVAVTDRSAVHVAHLYVPPPSPPSLLSSTSLPMDS